MIYAVATSFEGPIKIGRTENFIKRKQQIQTGLTSDLDFWVLIDCLDENDISLSDKDGENLLHKYFHSSRIKREWFDLSFENLFKSLDLIVRPENVDFVFYDFSENLFDRF